MKTKIALLFLSAACGAVIAADVPAAAAGATGTASETPSCCAPAKPAPASCCAAPDTAAVAASIAPLSSRSIYQLDAKWADDAGQSVSLATLRGRPVVMAMFFASCEYACPVLVNDMKRLRALLPESVRATAQFVLVSFDTARDTSAVLSSYRGKSELDSSWTLLRGEDASVQELAMLLGVKFKQDARGQFAHSNLITVLNGEGEVAHQHAGLMGDVSEVAKAVTLASKPIEVASR
ncbi:MAG: SCO family protein [Opitutaceae bacterium]|nr:SCO family protein [Opitutaceae bacterium]